jgi:ribosome-binding factor A
MRSAVAFVMPLGGGRVEAVIEALNHAAPYVRRAVGERVVMKFVPEFRFVADSTFDQASRIEALLRSPSVARDLADPSEGKPDDGA